MVIVPVVVVFKWKCIFFFFNNNKYYFGRSILFTRCLSRPQGGSVDLLITLFKKKKKNRFLDITTDVVRSCILSRKMLTLRGSEVCKKKKKKNQILNCFEGFLTYFHTYQTFLSLCLEAKSSRSRFKVKSELKSVTSCLHVIFAYKRGNKN